MSTTRTWDACVKLNMHIEQGDGPDVLCFNGEIKIESDVKIGGFKAGGLSVRVSAFNRRQQEGVAHL